MLFGFSLCFIVLGSWALVGVWGLLPVSPATPRVRAVLGASLILLYLEPPSPQSPQRRGCASMGEIPLGQP
jgi:hypothetical protein